MFANEAVQLILEKYPAKDYPTLLDVGAGNGVTAEIFRNNGYKVTTLGLNADNDICGFFEEFTFTSNYYDIVWASHVLEHTQNVSGFLKNMCGVCKLTGVVAITVPPLKHEIVGGHLSLWNMGLLAYNLIVAGFDLTNAHTAKYGYNISIVVKRIDTRGPTLLPLSYDHGDIELLRRYFPKEWKVFEGFNGNDLPNTNWL